MTIDKSYYYSAEEWSRSIGYGEVPTDRSQPMIQLELFPELKPTGANELNTIKNETCLIISLSSRSSLAMNCEHSLSVLIGLPGGKAKVN